MRALGTPPKLQDFEVKNQQHINSWFYRVTQQGNVQSGANNPTVTEVPENQWMIYTNTSLGETRIWANIGGTLVKSAAFT